MKTEIKISAIRNWWCAKILSVMIIASFALGPTPMAFSALDATGVSEADRQQSELTLAEQQKQAEQAQPQPQPAMVTSEQFLMDTSPLQPVEEIQKPVEIELTPLKAPETVLYRSTVGADGNSLIVVSGMQYSISKNDAGVILLKDEPGRIYTTNNDSTIVLADTVFQVKELYPDDGLVPESVKAFVANDLINSLGKYGITLHPDSNVQPEVVEATQTQWSDGCLGWPEPGMSCTGFPISNGFIAKVKLFNNIYEYHGDMGNLSYIRAVLDYGKQAAIVAMADLVARGIDIAGILIDSSVVLEPSSSDGKILYEVSLSSGNQKWIYKIDRRSGTIIDDVEKKRAELLNKTDQATQDARGYIDVLETTLAEFQKEYEVFNLDIADLQQALANAKSNLVSAISESWVTDETVAKMKSLIEEVDAYTQNKLPGRINDYQVFLKTIMDRIMSKLPIWNDYMARLNAYREEVSAAQTLDELLKLEELFPAQPPWIEDMIQKPIDPRGEIKNYVDSALSLVKDARSEHEVAKAAVTELSKTTGLSNEDLIAVIKHVEVNKEKLTAVIYFRDSDIKMANSRLIDVLGNGKLSSIAVYNLERVLWEVQPGQDTAEDISQYPSGLRVKSATMSWYGQEMEPGVITIYAPRAARITYEANEISEIQWTDGFGYEIPQLIYRDVYSRPANNENEIEIRRYPEGPQLDVICDSVTGKCESPLSSEPTIMTLQVLNDGKYYILKMDEPSLGGKKIHSEFIYLQAMVRCVPGAICVNPPPVLASIVRAAELAEVSNIQIQGTSAVLTLPDGSIHKNDAFQSLEQLLDWARRVEEESNAERKAAIERAVSNLAEALGLTDEEKKSIEVLKADPIQWTNGCVGWDQPGQMCTMNLVNGYLVLLKLYQNEYEFHAGRIDPYKDAAIHAINDLRNREGIMLQSIVIQPMKIEIPVKDEIVVGEIKSQDLNRTGLILDQNQYREPLRVRVSLLVNSVNFDGTNPYRKFDYLLAQSSKEIVMIHEIDPQTGNIFRDINPRDGSWIEYLYGLVLPMEIVDANGDGVADTTGDELYRPGNPVIGAIFVRPADSNGNRVKVRVDFNQNVETAEGKLNIGMMPDVKAVEASIIDLLEVQNEKIDRLMLSNYKLDSTGMCTMSIPPTCYSKVTFDLQYGEVTYKYEVSITTSNWNETSYSARLLSKTDESEHKVKAMVMADLAKAFGLSDEQLKAIEGLIEIDLTNKKVTVNLKNYTGNLGANRLIDIFDSYGNKLPVTIVYQFAYRAPAQIEGVPFGFYIVSAQAVFISENRYEYTYGSTKYVSSYSIYRTADISYGTYITPGLGKPTSVKWTIRQSGFSIQNGKQTNYQYVDQVYTDNYDYSNQMLAGIVVNREYSYNSIYKYSTIEYSYQSKYQRFAHLNQETLELVSKFNYSSGSNQQNGKITSSWSYGDVQIPSWMSMSNSKVESLEKVLEAVRLFESMKTTIAQINQVNQAIQAQDFDMNRDGIVDDNDLIFAQKAYDDFIHFNELSPGTPPKCDTTGKCTSYYSWVGWGPKEHMDWNLDGKTYYFYRPESAADREAYLNLNMGLDVNKDGKVTWEDETNVLEMIKGAIQREKAREATFRDLSLLTGLSIEELKEVVSLKITSFDELAIDPYTFYIEIKPKNGDAVFFKEARLLDPLGGFKYFNGGDCNFRDGKIEYLELGQWGDGQNAKYAHVSYDQNGRIMRVGWEEFVNGIQKTDSPIDYYRYEEYGRVIVERVISLEKIMALDPLNHPRFGFHQYVLALDVMEDGKYHIRTMSEPTENGEQRIESNFEYRVALFQCMPEGHCLPPLVSLDRIVRSEVSQGNIVCFKAPCEIRTQISEIREVVNGTAKVYLPTYEENQYGNPIQFNSYEDMFVKVRDLELQQKIWFVQDFSWRVMDVQWGYVDMNWDGLIDEKDLDYAMDGYRKALEVVKYLDPWTIQALDLNQNGVIDIGTTDPDHPSDLDIVVNKIKQEIAAIQEKVAIVNQLADGISRIGEGLVDINGDGKVNSEDQYQLERIVRAVALNVTEKEIKLADTNGDGKLVCYYEWYCGEDNPWGVDYNGDGILDDYDYDRAWAVVEFSSLNVSAEEIARGDINRDGEINQADVDTFIRQLYENRSFDLNGDGVVDGGDLLLVKDGYNYAFQYMQYLSDEAKQLLDYDDYDGISWNDEVLLEQDVQHAIDIQRWIGSAKMLADILSSDRLADKFNVDRDELGLITWEDVNKAEQLYNDAINVLPYLSQEVKDALDYNHDGQVGYGYYYMNSDMAAFTGDINIAIQQIQKVPTVAKALSAGTLDMDGYNGLNESDITYAKDAYAAVLEFNAANFGNVDPLAFDYNRDGKVTGEDVSQLTADIQSALTKIYETQEFSWHVIDVQWGYADINWDGLVNADDLKYAEDGYRKALEVVKYLDPWTVQDLDLNQNGIIDIETTDPAQPSDLKIVLDAILQEIIPIYDAEINAALTNLNALLGDLNAVILQKADIETKYSELSDILNGKYVGPRPMYSEILPFYHYVINRMATFSSDFAKAIETKDADLAAQVIDNYNKFMQEGDVNPVDRAVDELGNSTSYAIERLHALPGMIEETQAKIDARSAEWRTQAEGTLNQYDKAVKGFQFVSSKGEFLASIWPSGEAQSEPTVKVMTLIWVEHTYFDVQLADGQTLNVEFQNGVIDPAVKEILEKLSN